MKWFGLLIMGICLFLVSLFLAYGLLYLFETNNELVAWFILWGLVALTLSILVVGILIYWRVNQVQQQLDAVLLERDGLQQRLDLVLSERDELQKQFYQVLSKRDELQKQFYQVLSERDGLRQRFDLVLSEYELFKGLSNDGLCVLALVKRELSETAIASVLKIGLRTVQRTKAELREKKLL